MERRIRFGGTWTATVGALIGANVAVFVLQAVYPPLTGMLGLIPGHVLPDRLHTILTYSFLHGGVGHIFFNMLTLYFFGGDLDLFLGRRRFLILYFGSALAGGVAAALFLRGPVLIIGASGAVYGVLTAYALYFPRTEVLLWFLLPMKIWVLVLIWVGISLFFSLTDPSGGGIAHLAHLGGAVFAFFYVTRFWRPGGMFRDLRYRWRRRRFKTIQ
jgi:membrane associated rhomboid family serine protease